MPSLADLKPGQAATILDVEGEDRLATRLLELGFFEGQKVVLVGVAPLGDPLEFRIDGARISLRKADSARVSVQVIEDAGPGASPV